MSPRAPWSRGCRPRGSNSTVTPSLASSRDTEHPPPGLALSCPRKSYAYYDPCPEPHGPRHAGGQDCFSRSQKTDFRPEGQRKVNAFDTVKWSLAATSDAVTVHPSVSCCRSLSTPSVPRRVALASATRPGHERRAQKPITYALIF